MGYEKPQNVQIPKIRGWNVRNFLESHDELVGADDQIWGPETRNFDELSPRQFDIFGLFEHLFIKRGSTFYRCMKSEQNKTIVTYICIVSDREK